MFFVLKLDKIWHHAAEEAEEPAIYLHWDT